MAEPDPGFGERLAWVARGTDGLSGEQAGREHLQESRGESFIDEVPWHRGGGRSSDADGLSLIVVTSGPDEPVVAASVKGAGDAGTSEPSRREVLVGEGGWPQAAVADADAGTDADELMALGERARASESVAGEGVGRVPGPIESGPAASGGVVDDDGPGWLGGGIPGDAQERSGGAVPGFSSGVAAPTVGGGGLVADVAEPDPGFGQRLAWVARGTDGLSGERAGREHLQESRGESFIDEVPWHQGGGRSSDADGPPLPVVTSGPDDTVVAPWVGAEAGPVGSLAPESGPVEQVLAVGAAPAVDGVPSPWPGAAEEDTPLADQVVTSGPDGPVVAWGPDDTVVAPWVGAEAGPVGSLAPESGPVAEVLEGGAAPAVDGAPSPWPGAGEEDTPLAEQEPPPAVGPVAWMAVASGGAAGSGDTTAEAVRGPTPAAPDEATGQEDDPRRDGAAESEVRRPSKVRRRGRRRAVAGVSAAGVALVALVTILMRGLAAGTDGVWVSDLDAGSASLVDPGTGAAVDVVPVGSERFEILQDGATVVFDTEHWTAGVVSVGGALDETLVAVPSGSRLALGGGALAVLDGAGGRLWVMAPDELQDFAEDRTPTTVAGLSSSAALAVATTGTVFVADPSTATMTVVTTRGGVPNRTVTSQVSDVLPGDELVVTAVGSTPVVLDRTSGVLLLPDRSVRLDDARDLRLQRPGPTSEAVMLTSAAALITQPLDGAAATVVPAGGDDWAAPVVVDGCTYAAWSGTGDVIRDCPGDTRDARGRLDSAQGPFRFRVDAGRVVLNEIPTGRVWLVDGDLQQGELWPRSAPG